ncbi:hypothetical protein A3715_18985 [Oleiphilus sp. HI0009]|nr:hypothetical protein A3715_18985 [Oleiphilus sp. HI0009]
MINEQINTLNDWIESNPTSEEINSKIESLSYILKVTTLDGNLKHKVEKAKDILNRILKKRGEIPIKVEKIQRSEKELLSLEPLIKNEENEIIKLSIDEITKMAGLKRASEIRVQK